MSDVLRMNTPHASPDTLRAFLQYLSKLYDLYTKRYVGYTDIDGLQYVGTYENFGSEMLFETRKLRMNRPPVEVVQPSEYLSYYFDLTHSNFIHTYNQQNMVMAVLKKDVLLPNHKYTIRFTNVTRSYVLRAKAYSNPDVQYSAFYKTFDNPVIIIDDHDEIELFVQKIDNTDEHVQWFIQLDEVFSDLFELTMSGSGDYIEADLSMFVGIPAFMFCTKDMAMLPPVTFYGELDGVETGNVDWSGFPLLEFGTDGNDVTHLYPLVYDDDNVPEVHQTGYWILKVKGDFFSIDPTDNRNMTTSIHAIGYLHFEDDVDTPDFEYWMTYDEEYVRISLMETLKHDPGVPRNIGWTFRIPQPGDYDYDGRTYINPIVGSIRLDMFSSNTTIFPNESGHYIPAFAITFKDQYFHPYESEINNMDAGIHIDFTTDFSDHSVSKKYGVAHDLSDFDGLPDYYKYYMDRVIHHAHIELFAIRDDANVRNQKAMDKQTAGIIIDSGLPVNDYGEITSDMKPVIVYDTPGSLRYKTIPENIVSDVNCLSDIVAIDGNHFADINTPGHPEYKDLPRFIYHGNRYFSTGMINFDPDLEYARVYVISNDPASYENNNNAKNPKAERTFARMCDIPTSYPQLEHIPNQSPTIIIDEQYVRQPASFNENEFQSLWNQIPSKWYTIGHYKPSASPGYAPMVWIPSLTLLKQIGLYSTVMIKNGDVPTPQRTIALEDVYDLNGIDISPGENYAVDDTFGFNIGGIFIKGIVDEVDLTGGILNFRLINNTTIPDQDWSFPDIEIPVLNFNGQISQYPVSTLTGSGSGAIITIDIPLSVCNFNDVIRRDRTGIPNEVYTFIWRPLDGEGVCAIPYDFTNRMWDEDHMVQITGDLDVGDPYYENTYDKLQRTVSNVCLYNMLTNRNKEQDPILENTNGMKSLSLQTKYSPFYILGDTNDITIEELISGADIHEKVSDEGMNVWNSFISVVPTTDRQKYVVLTWMYDMNASYIEIRNGNGNMVFPKFSDMHVDSYDNAQSSIKFNIDSNNNIIPFMYDVMHNTYDSYTIDDAFRLTSQSVINLPSLIPKDISGFPDDIVDPYESNIASFNLYRFGHFQYIQYLKSQSEHIWDRSTDELYEELVTKFGEDNWITKYYGYEEKDYVMNQSYLEGDLIVYHSMNVVVYTEDTTYATDTIILDPDSRKMYRVVRGYVSANQEIAGDITPLQYDIEHGYLIYTGTKTTDNTDIVYIALKAFVATNIDADIADGSIQKIGPSAKRQAIINYLMENNYRQDELSHPYDLHLYTEKDQKLKVKDDEPIGGFLPLMDTLHENVTFNSKKCTVDPLYVFRIDTIIDTTTLDQLRMFDDDIDISDKTMLIIKQWDGSYRKYIFHNNHWEWDYVV